MAHAFQRELITIAVCFGLGLGFARTSPAAQACSCVAYESRPLVLDTIDGDGDPAFEQSYWSATASLHAELHGALIDVGQDTLNLDEVQ